MTEEEWLTCGDSWRMLEFIGAKASERKLRLFGCACVLRVLRTSPGDSFHTALDTAEGYAEGEVSDEEMAEVERHLHYRSGDESLRLCFGFILGTAQSGVRITSRGAELGVQNLVLRDIVGNPFRPVVFDSEWRTDTALSLARIMYESRDFSAMPILADALQDAGCDNEDILNHCRAVRQPHVRGCWVVDLVLGKS